MTPILIGSAAEAANGRTTVAAVAQSRRSLSMSGFPPYERSVYEDLASGRYATSVQE